jgi:bacillithiol system protein YtxJ
MEWLQLTSESQWDDLLKAEMPIVVFKHSTRCSISSMVKNRLERSWQLDIPVYYLDLIQYREVSNAIERDLGVQHESPQILLVKNGTCQYHASHTAIDAVDISAILT